MARVDSIVHIEERGEFDVDLIPAIAQGDLLALRVSGYCNSAARQHVLERLSGIQGEGYRDEPTFKKLIGGAVYDAIENPALLDSYLRLVPEWTHHCRGLFDPFLSPADRVLLELSESWQHGCGLARFNGRRAFAGLVRGFGVGAEARPHQDMTHWDIPQVPEVYEYQTQLSAITYFSSAEVGGELELWGFGFDDQAEYNAYRTSGDYGLDRNIIGRPSVVIRPEPGELIVFNARFVHAVAKIERGLRSSQSLFIGYRSNAAALSLYC